MIDFFKKSASIAFAFVTGFFTFAPESLFEVYEWISQDFLNQYKVLSGLNSEDVNIVVSRFLCFVAAWIMVLLGYALCLRLKLWTTIKGENYSIRVEYGDILKKGTANE